MNNLTTAVLDREVHASPVARPNSKFSSVKVGREFNMKAFFNEMQSLRRKGEDVTFKQYLSDLFGLDTTPQKFYSEVGINLSEMNVEKMINTSDLSRWLLPEIFRDAIRLGLQYTPFYSRLITSDENINGTGVTMPKLELIPEDELALRDTNQGASITEAEFVIWAEKQVSVKKKARGLVMTYESIMFTPINLATIYFQELGARLGATLDRDLINIAINGDQVNGSEASPVIGAATANTLLYTDIARAWIRFKRIGRNSVVMLTSEADAITIMNMPQFERKNPSPGATPSGVTVNVNTPLPTSQDIYVHDAIPTGKIILIDPAFAFVKLTAMPLLIEGDKVIRRQLNEEFVSMITGFANVFNDGRLILDYTTNLTTNPGPTVLS